MNSRESHLVVPEIMSEFRMMSWKGEILTIYPPFNLKNSVQKKEQIITVYSELFAVDHVNKEASHSEASERIRLRCPKDPADIPCKALIAEMIICLHATATINPWHYAAATAILMQPRLTDSVLNNDFPINIENATEVQIRRRNDLAESIRSACVDLAKECNINTSVPIEILNAGIVSAELTETHKEDASPSNELKFLNEKLIKILNRYNIDNEYSKALEDVSKRGGSLFAETIPRPIQLPLYKGSSMPGITIEIGLGRIIGKVIRKIQTEAAGAQVPVISAPIYKDGIKPIRSPQLQMDFILGDDNKLKEIKLTDPNRRKPQNIAALDLDVYRAIHTKNSLPKTHLDLRDVTNNQLKAFKSMPGQKVFEFMIRKSFEIHKNNPGAECHIIRIVGGYEELNRLIGRNSKDTQVLRDAIDFGRRVYLTRTINGVSHKMDSFWRADYIGASPEFPAQIVIQLHHMLCANYINRGDTEEDRAKGKARNALPILQYDLPQEGIAKRYLSKVRQLGQNLIEHMHDRRLEYKNRGSVKITKSEWQSMLHEQELPMKMLKPIQESWMKGEAGRPAFIEMSGEEVRLSAAYEASERFIIVGGERSIDGVRKQEQRQKKQKQQLEKDRLN